MYFNWISCKVCFTFLPYHVTLCRNRKIQIISLYHNILALVVSHVFLPLPELCFSDSRDLTVWGFRWDSQHSALCLPLPQDSDEVRLGAGESWRADVLRERSRGPGEDPGELEAGEADPAQPDEGRVSDHQLHHCCLASHPHSTLPACHSTPLWSRPLAYVKTTVNTIHMVT